MTKNSPPEKAAARNRVSTVRQWHLKSTEKSAKLSDIISNLEISWRALLRIEAQQYHQHSNSARDLTKTEQKALRLFGIQSLEVEIRKKFRAPPTKEHAFSGSFINEELKNPLEWTGFQIVNETTSGDSTATTDSATPLISSVSSHQKKNTPQSSPPKS